MPGSNALGAVGGGGAGGFGGGRAARATGTTGINFGGSGAGGSGFALYDNYTSQIDALSPLINSSMAVVERAGFVDADGLNSSATFYGVDFSSYARQYPTTFVAASGSIPANPSNNDIVVGTRVVDPRENGTILFNAGDNVGVVWTNATTLQIVNETYVAQVSGVLQKVGGFGFGGPSDSGVYMPLSQAQSFFGTTQCDLHHRSTQRQQQRDHLNCVQADN